MAERLDAVQERLRSIRELSEITGAVRAMAAARMQQAQEALGPIRAYADRVEGALGRVMAMLPSPESPPERRDARAVVVFSAEHGFAGAFSQRVLQALSEAEVRTATLFVLGSRGALVLEERGPRLAWRSAMATQVGAVTRTARGIAEELYRRTARGSFAAVEVVFARVGRPGEPMAIERRTVLPVEPERLPRKPRATPPLTNLAPRVLLERLLGEYVLARLVHAATESLASENAARLATTQSARRNIDEKLEELQLVEQRLRQEEITTELLDVVTGAEASRASR